MFWRSVVGKLAMTILLLVSFVLFILTILLLEFFENFHIQEAEKGMMETASKISTMIEQDEDQNLIIETTERVKDPATQVILIFEDGEMFISEANDDNLASIDHNWFRSDVPYNEIINNNETIYRQRILPDSNVEVMIVGVPVENEDAAIFVYQSLEVIEQTKAETTRIIFLAAGIAIILTTFFAFFLSTRITAPLIKMREAAFELTKGKFTTEVPILTNDEIGELALAFNQMGKQLNFHITALRQEKEQLSSILSSMADGVITLNRDGDKIVINPPAQQFLDIWHFEDQNQSKLPGEIIKLLEEVIHEEREAIAEISIQGRYYVILMTPLYDQNFIRGAVAVIRDMTEERKLDKLQKDFVANVSHELRTPLSLMQGYSEAIIDDIAESRGDKNELAKIIHDEAMRMSRLVNELLDLAKIEAGHIQLNTESIDVSSFIKRVSMKFDNILKEKEITLKINKNLRSKVAYFDDDQIEQVLTNLLDNSIRHMEAEGTILINLNNTEEKLILEIKDDGIGIDESDLPFIFERFYKVDKARTRNGAKKGTGLGLAIVKNILEAHNGTITVQSKKEKGTSFYIMIPNKSIQE